MALKRQYDIIARFSMTSMADVIFLLFVLFMVASTFVFPTALEVTLPQSSEQATMKPSTRVYIDKKLQFFASFGDAEPQPIYHENLVAFLQNVQEQAPDGLIALYADEEVPYGKVVEVLNMAASRNLKMVLATKPSIKKIDMDSTPAMSQ